MGLHQSSRFVVAMGGANMDIAARSHAALISADSNPGSIDFSPGGVARNVAENLCRLGVETRLLSVVGADTLGHSLLERCRAVGMDVRGCDMLEEQSTGTYLSIHGPDGDMALAVNDMAVLEQLSPERLRANSTLMQGAAAWVVDCNVPAASLGSLLGDKAFDLNGSAGKGAGSQAVFADAVSVAKCSRLLPLLPKLFALKVNAMEAQTLSGLAVNSVDEAMQAAALLCKAGPKWVVITLGQRGTVWCDDMLGPVQCGLIAARRVSVASATGAGDALLAGLVWAYLDGWSLDRATAFGVACAELTLQSPFANAPFLCVDAVLTQMKAAQ